MCEEDEKKDDATFDEFLLSTPRHDEEFENRNFEVEKSFLTGWNKSLKRKTKRKRSQSNLTRRFLDDPAEKLEEPGQRSGTSSFNRLSSEERKGKSSSG